MENISTVVLTTRSHLRVVWLWPCVWTIVIVASACGMAIANGHGGVPLVFTAAALAALLFPYLAFAFTSFDRDVMWWLRPRPARLLAVAAAMPCVYVVYALGTQTFDWTALARLTAFVAVPTSLIYSARGKEHGTWQDWLAVAAIWLPFDTGYLKGIWAWPAGDGAYILNTALAVTLAILLFVCSRRLTGVNFRMRLGRGEARIALVALLGFMAIALPFGFATGFIKLNPDLSWARVVGAPLGIFFFIAVPEELLFRGLLQNLLDKRLGKPLLALAIASVFFGATHLNNGPVPDWRYFVLATLAGGFYGWAFTRTRSLLAPALVHAAVDTLWVLLFMAGPR